MGAAHNFQVVGASNPLEHTRTPPAIPPASQRAQPELLGAWALWDHREEELQHHVEPAQLGAALLRARHQGSPVPHTHPSPSPQCSPGCLLAKGLLSRPCLPGQNQER